LVPALALRYRDGEAIAMKLARLWSAVAGERRAPTSSEIFARARRARDRGRFEAAAALVASGLEHDPDSIVGRLLSGSLHVIFREMEPAKADFERVLALDRHQPRALLGLARLALEEGDAAGSVALLRRALERYPDFPEAEALLDVIAARAAAPPAPPPVATAHPELDLRVPPISHELLFLARDGALLFAHPRSVPHEASAAHMLHVMELAEAIGIRCGHGALRRIVLDGATETVHARRDDGRTLSMTVRADLDADLAAGHLDRLWEAAVAEAPTTTP
jgi:tetratricopeptide (TPR) repeat protein